MPVGTQAGKIITEVQARVSNPIDPATILLGVAIHFKYSLFFGLLLPGTAARLRMSSLTRA
jgi:hypothetical protein